MKIAKKVITKNIKDNWFTKIVNSLEGIDCGIYVKDLIKLSQSKQKIKVSELQGFIVEYLKSKFPEYNWHSEYKIDGVKRDLIDIYGEKNDNVFIIELDKWRADQIPKKVISRTALLINKNIGFVSLCYGGTPSMSKAESIKYFSYCEIVMSKLNNFYSGLIIE